MRWKYGLIQKNSVTEQCMVYWSTRGAMPVEKGQILVLFTEDLQIQEEPNF